MIQESELILNADGSIYHLHLQPEQVAPIIFTVGDPDRVGAVSRYFDKIEHKVRKREFVTHTGWLGNTRLSVISTGIGTDNIDIVINELDALFNFDLQTRAIKKETVPLTIIRLGTTGSIQHEVTVDSLLACEGAFGLDGLMHFYDANPLCDNDWVQAFQQHAAQSEWDCPALPYYVPAAPRLLDLFSKTFLTGITATNIGFYAPQGRQLRAKAKKSDYISFLQTFDYQGCKIANLEMETSAILGLAHILGHQAISLNAVLANRADGTFSRNPNKAVKKMIESALSLL